MKQQTEQRYLKSKKSGWCEITYWELSTDDEDFSSSVNNSSASHVVPFVIDTLH